MGIYAQPDGSFKHENECPVCHEDYNMYGGCKCNGYTTAFNNKYKKNHGGCMGHSVSYGADGTEFECDYEHSGDITCGQCMFGDCGGNIDPRRPISKQAAWYIKAPIWVLNVLNKLLGWILERR